MTDRYARINEGRHERLHRCLSCVKISHARSGVPATDNGFRPRTEPLRHVRGCPASDWSEANLGDLLD